MGDGRLAGALLAWLDPRVPRIAIGLRIASLGVLCATAPLALVVSCTKSGSGALDAGPAALADGTVGDGAICPPPSTMTQRCSGSDPAFVFFPPLSCDPASLVPDAGAGDANQADAAGDDAGDAASNACANVNQNDVSFTTAACTAFVGAHPAGYVSDAGSPRAPQITEPSDGDALTPDNWAIFAWNAGSARLSPLERVLEWIEPSAHALSPLTGSAYVLTFSQGCTEALRVMLVETFWVPDPVSWGRLTALSGPVTVRVTSAKFKSDEIAPGSQAFVSAPITITMKN